MLPGKVYSPEELLRLLRKRMWLLLVPMAVVTAVATIVIRQMPNYYRAETTILVVPQRVPESYVKSTVTARISDRLQTISPTIQSRTRLERIIQDLDLYAAERKAMPMEDVVARMRRNIDVQIVRDDSFIVRYVGQEPRKVMEVTNRLASLYIDASVTDRQRQAEGTDDFLESQLLEAKQLLVEKERALESYRRDHALELPSQVESNLQQVRNAQAQIQAQVEMVSRLQERKGNLEHSLAELQASSAELAGTTEAGQVSGSGSTAQQVAVAESQLSALRGRGLKPGHPDLDSAVRTLRDLRKKLDDEMSAATPAPASMPPGEAARRRRVAELTDQIADLSRQIARARTEEEHYRAAGDAAQSRIDLLPTRESELTELMRDYSTFDATYKSLLAKKEDSKISANLERQQIGEQFKLLDPAQLPVRPVSPNRTQLTSMAAGFGLVIGICLAGFLEYRDQSFKTDQDIAAVLSLPVLATVPLMRSEAEERRQMLTLVATDVGCGLVVAACLSLVLYTLVR